MTRAEFAATYWPAAQKAQRRHGIPAKFIISQIALETGYGKHMRGHNVAGIKARRGSTGAPSEPAFLAWTTEYLDTLNDAKRFPAYDLSSAQKVGGRWKVRVKDYFRKFPSPAAGIERYLNLLNGARYAPAKAKAGNWLAYGRDVVRRGYATLDPDEYARRLNSVYSVLLPDLPASRPSLWPLLLVAAAGFAFWKFRKK